MKNFKDKISSLPDSAGVYSMKDAGGKVIYIGKAASLKNRVGSYFQKSLRHPPKTYVMLEQVKDIDYILCGSEEEALLLEASLIKKNKPKYNVSLRDDKSFPVVKITQEPFPAVFVGRPKKNDRSLYIGPFTNATMLRRLVKKIRRIFPFCICRPMPKKPCLDYHLNLCPAPCIGKISKNEYRRTIQDIRMFLEGKFERLLKRLRGRMLNYAAKQKFEEASLVRNQIKELSGLVTNVSGSNQLESLKAVLGLPRLPRRIEAFDVSNIFGSEATGSMISFLNGQPDKDNYRRFKIKDVSGIDDYRSLAEIIRRRYRRVLEENLELPDLIIVDGGKGQVKAAKEVLAQIGLDIPLIGIAKRNEEIFSPHKKEPIILSLDAPALHLIQHIRNEAHRFAIKYHHLLRRKKIIAEPK